MRREKSFKDLVFEYVKLIPKGKVLTYKCVAVVIKHPKSARAVGNALNKNCDSKVPCHRVVKSDGKIGGFNRGAAMKIKILQGEGVEIINGKVRLEKYLLRHRD